MQKSEKCCVWKDTEAPWPLAYCLLFVALKSGEDIIVCRIVAESNCSIDENHVKKKTNK